MKDVVDEPRLASPSKVISNKRKQKMKKMMNKMIVKGILAENFAGFYGCDDSLEGIMDMIDQDWVKDDFEYIVIEIEKEDPEDFRTDDYEFNDWDSLKDFLYERRHHLSVDDVWMAGDDTCLGFTMSIVK